MMRRQVHENGVVTYMAEPLTQRGVTHAFTTRVGGMSRPPFDTLNLATAMAGGVEDDPTAVAENFRRLRGALGVERVVRVQVRQVHGAAVWVPPAEPIKPTDAPEADAMISDDPSHLLTIRVADCVPILLAGPAGRVVAAVHAGWRGLVAGVVERTLAAMAARFDVRSAELAAGVGPCISAAHYEVGPEVAAAFEAAGLGEAVRPAPTVGASRPHIDLRAAATAALAAGGVPGEAIAVSSACTYAEAREFFSHRRDAGRTGRQAAVIRPRGVDAGG